jgi:hypothetical protein
LGNPKQKTKSSVIRKFRFIVEFIKANSFFSSGVFQVLGFFCLAVFSSLAKVQVHFYRFPKSAGLLLPAFLFKFSFDWLYHFLFAVFVVGFVGSQNRLAFFLQCFG